MTSIQRWSMDDIWHYGRVNIDPWTETYSVPFYMYYTLQWPELGWTARNNNGDIVGYIIGQADSKKETAVKGHVTAVTIAEDNRRTGLATKLMHLLEDASEEFVKAHFVDLFVRPTNMSAQTMYEKLGYKLYRRIINYYETIHEDGFDMRKSLSRDPEKKSMVPLPKPVTKDELDWTGPKH